jgi:hypothetical protein
MDLKKSETTKALPYKKLKVKPQWEQDIKQNVKRVIYDELKDSESTA